MQDFRLVRYRGKWCLYWRDGGRPHRRSTGYDAVQGTRPEAEAALESLRAEQRRSDAAPRGVINVAAILTGYLAGKPGVIPRPTVARFFGRMMADHIDRRACARFVAERKKAGASDATVHTELSLLRTALRWAERERWIDRAPWIERPHRGAARERWLTVEECDRLQAAAAAPHVRLFIAIARYTGARSGAILGLTWDRVDFARERIDFRDPTRPENRKRRAVVRMSAQLAPILREAAEARTCDHVVEYGGGPVASIKRGFREAARRAGIEATPHTLRHSVATWLRHAGVPVAEAARFLGMTITTYDSTYAKHSTDYQSASVEALDAQSSTVDSARRVQVNTRTVNGSRNKARKPSNRRQKSQ